MTDNVRSDAYALQMKRANREERAKNSLLNAFLPLRPMAAKVKRLEEILRRRGFDADANSVAVLHAEMQTMIAAVNKADGIPEP